MNKISRRAFVEKSLLVASASLLPGKSLFGQPTDAGIHLRPARVLLDMVHNNPGEAPFITHYNDPSFLKQLGYQSKVYELFEGAQFGIDWSSIDPDIFATGSPEHAWVNQKAADLDKLYTATKQAGLSVYCHTDMIVFPKKLVEKYPLINFKQISNPETQKYLRAAIQQMFSRFPQLDGLVVRIGETYLQGAPYHTGGIDDKTSPEKTIIPLINLLRDEACDKLNRKVIFRSWMSFDNSIPAYQAVSNGVEPHPNLLISVKHCEGDFHWGNPFSRVLGIGRHSQVVEVQCQREYEGKGAYPNYIAHGVTEGFEEHDGQSLRKIWSNPLIAGMFTWSRGGGWKGPYITNELWCDLNTCVLSRWAQNPDRSEESIFNEYCSTILKLSAEDAATFRKLACSRRTRFIAEFEELTTRSAPGGRAINTWGVRPCPLLRQPCPNFYNRKKTPSKCGGKWRPMPPAFISPIQPCRSMCRLPANTAWMFIRFTAMAFNSRHWVRLETSHN